MSRLAALTMAATLAAVTATPAPVVRQVRRPVQQVAPPDVRLLLAAHHTVTLATVPSPDPALDHAASVVGWCESRDSYILVNPASGAAGRWQFLASTWTWVWNDMINQPPPTPTADLATPADQRRAFDALWSSPGGPNHWNPSRFCWEGKL